MAKLAVGGVTVAAIPVALATPAGATYTSDDFQDVTTTFVRNGQTITCKVRGRTNDGFPVGDSDDASISSITIVSNDPGCEDAVYQASLSGTCETAPDSGELVRFSAQEKAASGSTPGDIGALATLRVPGPTGHITMISHCLGVFSSGFRARTRRERRGVARGPTPSRGRRGAPTTPRR